MSRIEHLCKLGLSNSNSKIMSIQIENLVLKKLFINVNNSNINRQLAQIMKRIHSVDSTNAQSNINILFLLVNGLDTSSQSIG